MTWTQNIARTHAHMCEHTHTHTHVNDLIDVLSFSLLPEKIGLEWNFLTPFLMKSNQPILSFWEWFYWALYSMGLNLFILIVIQFWIRLNFMWKIKCHQRQLTTIIWHLCTIDGVEPMILNSKCKFIFEFEQINYLD